MDLGDFFLNAERTCNSKLNVYFSFYSSIAVTTITTSLILRYVLKNINGNPKIRRCRDSKFLFPWLFLLFNFGCLTLGVLKVCLQGQNYMLIIGRDNFITVLASCGPFLAHSSLVLYYDVVIKMLKNFTKILTRKEKRALDRKFLILSLLALTIPILSFLCSFSISVGLLYDNHFKTICFMIYLIGSGVLSLFYGLLICLALSFVIKEFDDYIRESSFCPSGVKTIRWRFNVVFYLLSITTVATGFSFIVFGCIETIKPNTTYMLLATLTGCCMASAILTLTIAPASSQRKSISIQMRSRNKSQHTPPNTKMVKFDFKFKPLKIGVTDDKNDIVMINSENMKNLQSPAPSEAR